MKKTIQDSTMVDHLAYLYLADLITEQTDLNWQDSKKLSRKIMDEMSGTSELFG